MLQVQDEARSKKNGKGIAAPSDAGSPRTMNQGPGSDTRLEPDSRHEGRREQARPAASSAGAEPLSLEHVKHLHVERVLEMCGGNRVRAARILGIGRTSLYRFLKRRQQEENSLS